MSVAVNPKLETFAEEHELVGLTLPSLQAIVKAQKGYSVHRARRFLRFQACINTKLLCHHVIKDNRYTTWFKQGRQTEEQIKTFIVQFSVFSNLFLIAQLYKTINADSLEGMRASKEILANEIGVVFKSGDPKQAANDDVDPQLVSCEGTIEGGTFRFRAAHFEWLLKIASKLGLDFNDVGKRRNGSRSTLFFCDELKRLYGSEDYLISQAASYAVENWAAAGFWDELVEGFEKYNERTGAKLPLAFFTWHARLEAQHAQHTQEELEELYFSTELDEDAFIRHGNEMLDGVAVFWHRLEEQRKKLQCP